MNVDKTGGPAGGYSVARPPGIDLRLDANEGPPPPVEFLAEFGASMRRRPDLVNRYPAVASLERVLASRMGVAPQQVVVTAGGDDALGRLCAMSLGPGREIILPTPTFEMLERYSAMAGAAIASPVWAGGPFPTEAVIAAIGPATGAIAVVTPNNPTGAVATEADLRRVAEAARESAAKLVVIVDLAYTEFADQDLTAAALSLPNTVVVRTLSKAWGLAGLRVGWAVGPTELIARMRAAGHPYAVSGLSAAMAEAWLGRGGASVDGYVARVRREREELREVLTGLGAEVGRSQANFVLAKVNGAATLATRLAARGVGVRVWAGRAGLEDCMRITCPGSGEGLARLVLALREEMGGSR
jgi:histidinol-phosphate aminotransferase